MGTSASGARAAPTLPLQRAPPGAGRCQRWCRRVCQLHRAALPPVCTPARPFPPHNPPPPSPPPSPAGMRPAGSLTRIAQKMRQRVFKLSHMRAELQASPEGEGGGVRVEWVAGAVKARVVGARRPALPACPPARLPARPPACPPALTPAATPPLRSCVPVPADGVPGHHRSGGGGGGAGQQRRDGEPIRLHLSLHWAEPAAAVAPLRRSQPRTPPPLSPPPPTQPAGPRVLYEHYSSSCCLRPSECMVPCR